MGRSIPILAGFFFMAYINYAGPCPDQAVLMKNLRSRVDYKVVSAASQISHFLPYLDSLRNCPSAEDSVIALLNKRLGSLYSENNDDLNAIKYYSRFLEVTRANLGKPNFNAFDMMAGYYYYAEMCRNLNKKREWLSALDSCISYAERIKVNNRANLSALYQLTEYYFDQGDYYRSIDYATKCETIAKICQDSLTQRTKDDGFYYNTSSSSWKILALIQLGNLDEAEAYIKTKIKESENRDSKFNLQSLYGSLAEVYVKKKDFTNAILLLNKSFKIAFSKGNYFSCKQILNTLGKDIYFDGYRDLQNAMKCYIKALSFINDNDVLKLADQIETLNIYTNIAEIHIDSHQFDTAFVYFQKAFDQIIPGESEEQVLKTANPSFLKYKKVYYVTNLMIAKGEAYRKKYLWSGNKNFLHDALHRFRLTDQFLDLLRKEQTGTDSKLFWRKDTRRLYERAIDASYALQDDDDAFYFFEKSRAVLLNDQLTHQRWAGDSEIEKEIQLTKELLQLQREIDTTDRSTPKYGDLVNKKISRVREQENLRNKIKENNPLYYHNQVDTSTMKISQVRNFILPGYQALMEIFAGDSAVYVLIITERKNSLRKLDKRQYTDLSNEFAGMLLDPGILNKNFNDFKRTAGELYTLIFQGINIPAGRMVISPDGPSFPFEALIVSKINEPLRYLVHNYAVSYTYSVKYLESGLSSPKATAMDFFGMAPVKFHSSFKLVPLPGSDQSLNKINSLFRNSVIVTGQEATPKKFMNEFFQFQVVQLYTHAADSGRFSEPVIYFGDSSINLSDLVYEKRPITRLIVLSACETASGKFYQGEGVFSFSRGFAALGIPSSISNLWSVENESTYKLTELFYKYLADGIPLDVALQKAKIEFYNSAGREKQLPYFWSALILAGRADPIVISKPLPVAYKLTALLAVLCIIALSVKWWTRKRSNRVQDKVGNLT